MSFTLVQSFKESIPLFRFNFGTQVIRATTWKSPILWKGEVYKPEPGIECRLPKQGSGLSEEEATLEVPTLRSIVHPELSSMAIQMSKPRALPTTRVMVMNLLRSGVESKLLYLYEGKLEKVTRNPDGKKSIVRLTLKSELASGLDTISLGRSCDPECGVIFGSAGCWVDNTQFFNPANGSVGSPGNSLAHFQKVRRAKVIASFNAPYNSREVSLLLDTTAPEHAGMGVAPYAAYAQLTITQQSLDWWVRSYLEKDGVRVTIQQWKQNSALFVLNRIPPESWDGARLTLVPDCTRTPTACSARQNSDNFGGLGIGIPAYNPTLEQQ